MQRYNVRNGFEREASRNSFRGRENPSYLLNPYVVHRAGFMRIVFAGARLDDPRNTVNLSLRVSWEIGKRLDVRNRLLCGLRLNLSRWRKA